LSRVNGSPVRVDRAPARSAEEAWEAYLKTGKLSTGQLKAASAKSAAELGEALKAK
jgi:hypothetical protein